MSLVGVAAAKNSSDATVVPNLEVGVLEATVSHLLDNVMPAAVEYEEAEAALSRAHKTDPAPAKWEVAARTAKRKAAELAIAIDGLTDRAHKETGVSKSEVRRKIAALSFWRRTSTLRQGSVERVRGIANAYKHHVLTDPTLPISSESDILIVGLGYGLDGFGVGKFGGVEVLVRESTGSMWKYLGDAPTVIGAWFAFLRSEGATLPPEARIAFGLQVHP
jgi:hypothetical protein